MKTGKCPRCGQMGKLKTIDGVTDCAACLRRFALAQKRARMGGGRNAIADAMRAGR